MKKICQSCSHLNLKYIFIIVEVMHRLISVTYIIKYRYTWKSKIIANKVNLIYTLLFILYIYIPNN